ncbi:hypothetical protein CK203_060468 [Vitis vinifera]|uniref:Uncharacterized protein n=1 Tax=Vitis vinifera TaxID=29760 RepID=A0A438GJQ9_VITVI|nr:hypothetical protein CK203_060468 [Vitis vinifera]
MGRTRQKQPRGEKPRKQSTYFKVRKFRTLISRCENFAHPKPRCEILGPKEEDFAHPYLKKLKDSPTQLKLWNPRAPTFPFRPWRRPEEAFPPPHPHRPSTTASAMEAAPSPPVQAPAIPPSEGEALLSADTPPGGHPRNLCHQRRKPETCFLGPLRREPSSRVLESIHASAEPLQRNLGFLWNTPSPYQASHDSGPPIEAARAQRFIPTAAEASAILPSSIYHRRTPGCHWSSHIAEALRIPYEPVIQADFREWSSFSQSDMVRILSRGILQLSVDRRELPSGMLLIDVLLRANLFPL